SAAAQRTHAHARLDAHLEALVAPLSARPEERLTLARWSRGLPRRAALRRRGEAVAPLAALLELAARLNHARNEPRRALGPCVPLARAADALQGTADHARLRAGLVQWLTALARPARPPLRPGPPEEERTLPGDLEGLVARLARRRDASNT
ncbi:MAG: hypothetical protein K1X89_18245, partial [Myxococcaceae bacterium]|nr:hypothetical protein [Myxococcaceae bacterium]